jgi:GntR family transcriptional regulator
MIAASGFEPGVNIGQATVVQADVDMALDLGVNQGSDLLRVEKVFTADGVPVIYVVNLTPVAVLGEELMVEAVHRPSITEPIYKFLEDCCQRDVEYHIATLEAMHVQEFETRIPNVDPLSPILVMKSVAFDADDQPVFRSLSAYPDKRMRFRLLRQRLAKGRIRCEKEQEGYLRR